MSFFEPEVVEEVDPDGVWPPIHQAIEKSILKVGQDIAVALAGSKRDTWKVKEASFLISTESEETMQCRINLTLGRIPPDRENILFGETDPRYSN